LFPLRQANFVTVTAVILFLIYVIYYFVGLLMARKMSRSAVPTASWFMVDKEVFMDSQHARNEILIFIAIVLMALCLNAAVTGLLSAPYNRYQARVIWLVPFLGMYIACLRSKKLIQSHKAAA
jgi:hypothetical protein